MATVRLAPVLRASVGGSKQVIAPGSNLAEVLNNLFAHFPGLKEVFFDDDTFNFQKARTLDVVKELKRLRFTWSCTSRVTTDY